MTGRRLLLAGSAAIGAVAAVLIALTVLAPSSSADVDPPGEGSADVGFARDMAVHHQQAVEMSFLVRDRTDDEAVRLLAYDIINTQANQRGMMLGWLETWGVPKSTSEPMRWMDGADGGEGTAGAHGHGAGAAAMPGMATDEELDELRAAEGRDAEVLYLRLMTEHHRGGVQMAEAAVERAGGDEITNLAAGMVRAQGSEIQLMADMLAERGA
ncbi:DUF305 domain-containing protein [Streptomyces sp. NBC_01803]|uniref:DUF305 domain-containing protein n=1 Tax=Streptomyces sp. NBC_01803 TaxID=2975946 RepID=UPI002DDA5AD8|nr:DUF305 domain-containing protein [Streptomyces sp. NBC_01803]WSA46962.1 DUF305 domain-containing protein [Streptomyces sp. NBC_01803]